VCLKKNDETFSEGGLTFLMDNDLLEQVKPVRVDHVRSVSSAGFAISADMSKMLSSESCF
jgi:hypothetical protein